MGKLVLQVLDVMLGGILGLFEILIASYPSAKMDWEVSVNDLVNSRCKGGEAIKDSDLVRGQGWTGVVNRDNLENAGVDRIA